MEAAAVILLRRLVCIGLGAILTSSACSRVHDDLLVTHRDPLGFTIQVPLDWTVSARDGSLIVATGPGGRMIVAQPFFQPRPVRAQAWLQQAPDLFPGLFPNARIERSAGAPGGRDDRAVAVLTYQANGQRYRSTLLCAMSGPSGMAYAISAPADMFDANKALLVRILQTLSFTRATGAPESAPALAFDRWEDPRELAFTLDVPRGWLTTGGAFRHSVVDLRSTVRTRSGDGAITVRMGDEQLPIFTIPNPLLAKGGFVEGSSYPIGEGLNTIVRRLVTGQAFAGDYAGHSLVSECGDLKVESRERPDASATLNRLYARLGISGAGAQLDTGEAAMSCTARGQTYRGYVFAGVLAYTNGTVGNWMVQPLVSYVAAADRVDQAAAVLSRMTASFRISPEWERIQQRIALNTPATVAQTGAAISKIISDTYQSKWATLDNVFRHWSNTTLGLTDVKDADGNTWKAASGHNYYWANGDTVASTTTSDRPDLDLTPLTRW